MATFDAHANFAQTLVAVAPSPATSGTSLTVSTGTGALLPSAPFNMTVQPEGIVPTSATAEIVRVTAIAGDVLTITRVQEGTTALAIAVGYQIGATVTAKTLTDIETAVNSGAVSGSLTVTGASGPIIQAINTGSSQTVLQLTSDDTSSAAINSVDVSDGFALYRMLIDGSMTWGSGSAARDTNLYRASAGLLQTDDNLQVGETLTVEGTTTVNAQVAVNRTTDSSAVNATYTTTSNATNSAFAYTAVANTGRLISAQVTGDTAGRFLVDVNGTMTWGPGNASRDTTLERVGVGQLGIPGTVLVGAATALGDNGAGEIQLANASTVPSTNPTAGVDIYAASSTSTPIKIRDTAGNVRSMVDAVTVLGTTSSAITTTAQTAVSGLAVTVEANATYLMEAVYYINSTVSTSQFATYSWTGPSGAAMQWGDTNTTGDYVGALTTTSSPSDIALNGVKHLLVMKGTLTTSTTAGTLTPTFGVSLTTGSPSYVLMAGSYVRLTRVI